MKIALINGSPRSQGATAQLLREAARYLEAKPETEVHYIELANMEMQFCRGCTSCYRTGQCVIQDDVEAIVAQVRASDGIIIGSPTYESNVSGLLKNFMDRGHFVMEQALRDKYGFAIATYEIADGHQVIKVLNKFFLVSGASRQGHFCLKLPFNGNPWAKGLVQRRLHKKLEPFYQAIKRRHHKSFFECLFNDLLVVHLIWKPIFNKNPERYAGILKAWHTNNIL